jgi:hypothetical protein
MMKIPLSLLTIEYVFMFIWGESIEGMQLGLRLARLGLRLAKLEVKVAKLGLRLSKLE